MATTEPELAPVWGESVSASPDLVRPSDGFIQSGWPLTSIPPSRGFINWVLKFASNAVTYLLELGIPNWQSTRVYPSGAVVRGGDGGVYQLAAGAGPSVAGTFTSDWKPLWDQFGVTPISSLMTSGLPNWTSSATYGPGAVVRDPNGAIFMLSGAGTATVGLMPALDPANWRQLFDWQGAPAGRMIRWTERWPVSGVIGGPSAGSYSLTLQDRRWTVTITGLGSAMTQDFGSVPGPGALANVLQLAPQATAVGNEVHVSSYDALGSFQPANRVTMDFDVWPGAAAVSESQIYLGFGSVSNTTVGLAGGLFFTDGTANWKCVCGSGAGLSAVTTTTVPVAGPAYQRMRIEWIGSAVNPAAVNQMNFYIDDALVATITTGLPVAKPIMEVFGAKKLSGSASLYAYVGPVQLQQNY